MHQKKLHTEIKKNDYELKQFKRARKELNSDQTFIINLMNKHINKHTAEHKRLAAKIDHMDFDFTSQYM